MDNQSPHRFFGLDAGRSGFRLYYSVSDSETGYVSEPAPITFEGATQLPSLVAIKDNNVQVFNKQADLLRLANQSPEGISLQQGLTEQLADNPMAERCVQALLEAIGSNLKARLSVTSFSPLSQTVNIGFPPAWANKPDLVKQLIRVVEQSGFQNVQAYPDAAAAVLYHIYSGALLVSDQEQEWLVIDVAETETRFTLIEKNGSSLDLHIKESFSESWGIEQIKQAFYRYLLASNKWKKPEPPDQNQQTALMVLVSELVTRYSKRPEQGATLDFRMDGVQDTVELTREVFQSEEIGVQVCEQFIRVINVNCDNPAFAQADRVLLVGGGAYWEFVRKAVEDRWGVEKCLFSKEPDRVVSKGLALERSEFVPPKPMLEKNVIDSNSITIEPGDTSRIRNIDNQIRIPSQDSQNLKPDNYLEQNQPSKKTGEENSAYRKEILHKKAWKIIIWCIVAGSIFALLVSPIPCAAWPVLLFLEAYMFYAIAKLYGYKLTSGLVSMMLIGLLGISFLLSLVIGEVVSLATAIIAAPIIKPVIAGLVIWGLGAAAIYILDRETFKG